MTTNSFVNLCKSKITNIFNDLVDKSANASVSISNDDVYEVWCSKSGCCNYALLSTTVPDGMYYEVTYNNWTNNLITNSYKKNLNKCISNIRLYGTDQFIDICADNIINFIKEKYDTDISKNEIDTLWHAKVLHHHKAVFTIPKIFDNDNLIFEITYNGISEDIYFDVYKKFDTNNYTIGK